MFYIYILKCEDGTFYKGIAKDINIRFLQHLRGKVGATKGKKPFLVHTEICKDRKEARKVEMYLKSGSGREIIKSLF